MKKIPLILLVSFFGTFSFADPPPWKSLTPDEAIITLVNEKYKNRVHPSGELSDQEKEFLLQLASYVTFLHVSDPSVLDHAVTRLFISIPSFISSNDLSDIGSLEAVPWQTYLPRYRTDITPPSGDPPITSAQSAGEELDFEIFFSEGILVDPTTKPMLDHLVQEIAESKEEIFMNAYGFDDLEGSMKPLFDSIKERRDADVDVRAIMDQEQETNGKLRTYEVIDDPKKPGFPKIIPLAPHKLIYSYTPPIDPEIRQQYWVYGRPAWMDRYRKLTPKEWKGLKDDARGEKLLLEGFPGGYLRALTDLQRATYDPFIVRMSFQYDGTVRMLSLLNEGVTRDEEAKGRVEWPSPAIQHNKYIVFDRSSVWAGTTNFSRTCIGTEENQNISILIRNEKIAKSFRDEFLEMFNFSGTETSPQIDGEFFVGSAHLQKLPNTNRYFTFKDGTRVRVHFSPTDDGEHRVILPMLYDSKPGDEIRILMFGNSGLEYIRAFQYAIARGADVAIIMDGFSGQQTTSWANWEVANLCQKSPFEITDQKPGKLLVYLETWGGLQHAKAASFTRKIKNSKRVIALIVGSQNWSTGGNDENDENMVSIYNDKKQLPQLSAYNHYFDQLLQKLESENVGPVCK